MLARRRRSHRDSIDHFQSHGKHEAVVVVGMLAYEIDATGSSGNDGGPMAKIAFVMGQKGIDTDAALFQIHNMLFLANYAAIVKEEIPRAMYYFSQRSMERALRVAVSAR